MAADEITVENLRQLLHIQTELREQAETRWRTAQRSLVSLMETFAPEVVDQRLKAGQPMDHLPVDELEHMIRQTIGSQLHQAQTVIRENQSLKALQELQEKVANLQADLNESQEENQRLENQVARLRAELSSLSSQFSALQQVKPITTNVEDHVNGSKTTKVGKELVSPPEPDWMAQWRKAETFERDANMIKIIGRTGLARRPLVEAQAAELLGIKKAGGSIQALMSRLVSFGLVEISRPWEADGAGKGGRFPDLVRLAEKGELAYWLLTGEKAQTNEYDLLLQRHVSPEHTLLNLQTADIFREAGYEVNLTPPEIQLPGGGLFKPDLVLTDPDGATLFVEVERDTDKNIELRQSKWRNFHQAGGGHLYIVCENRTSMRTIRSEINYSLGNRQATILMTNLAELQSGKRGNGDGLWLEIKQKTM